MKLFLGIVFTIIVCSFITNQGAFAEQSFSLEVDGAFFTIEYEIDADVLAMAIDKEQLSLLIGIEKTQDSVFYIKFPNEVISAPDNQFVVLVNGLEADYTANTSNDVTSLTFFVPVDSEEIEIIGTRVIPEFPLGFSLILSSLILSVIILSRIKNPLSNHFV